MIHNAMGMFGYMTEPEDVEVDVSLSRVVEAKGARTIGLLRQRTMMYSPPPATAPPPVPSPVQATT